MLDGVFVLFNIFLLLVGDYTFDRFSSSCSFNSYGTGKTSFVPYISALAEIIIFNINTAFGIYSLGYLIYSLKKKVSIIKVMNWIKMISMMKAEIKSLRIIVFKIQLRV